MGFFSIVYVVLLFSHGKFVTTFSWDDYTPFEITAYNDYERAVLYNWFVEHDWLIFLNRVTNQAALTMHILATDAKKFEGMLREYQIHYSYGTLDVKTSPETYSSLVNSRAQDPKKGFLTWQSIENWSTYKSNRIGYLEKWVMAKTYEKRMLYYLKASSGPKKFAAFVIAGENSRDWLSVAVTLNFLNNLLINKIANNLLDYYDLYFVPVGNPDGYDYSMKVDRFWSKNRKAFLPRKRCQNGTDAVGVNVDRNWFFYKTVPLSLEYECNSVYLGHQSISEEETKTISEFLNKQLASKLMAFISVKDFGKIISLPYANGEEAINHDLMMEIIPTVAERLYHKHKIVYGYGKSNIFHYNTTGNSADWVKKKLNVPIVLTIYLQQHNYLPIPRDIVPSTRVLTMLLNETLMLAKDIYGPVFGSQSVYYQACTTNILLSCMVTLVGKYY